MEDDVEEYLIPTPLTQCLGHLEQSAALPTRGHCHFRLAEDLVEIEECMEWSRVSYVVVEGEFQHCFVVPGS